MKNKNGEIGKAKSRLTALEKVTGSAKYAAEYNVPDLLYGYIVNSSVTKGKITALDETAVRGIPGVVDVLSHNNRPSLPWFDVMYSDMDAPPGSPFKPFYDNEIKYDRQPIALVVADSFETARYAAGQLKVTYETEDFDVDLRKNLDDARDPSKGLATLIKPLPPSPKGDFAKAYGEAAATYDGDFRHGTEHHNPMEMHATTTVYEGEGKLTIYDKTQGTNNSQIYVSNVFGLSYSDVRVLAPYVGGSFGSGLRPQYQLFVCVMAALHLKRNVRVSLDRKQMYTFGHRPQTVMKARFGADAAGKVTAMHHKAVAETSRFEDYNEVVVNWGNILYPAQNTLLEYQLVPLDTYTPIDMRAPGGSTGMHAVETAMDALAYDLKIDPLEFRLRNYAERDVSEDKPFSSKELRECYRQGAEKFGWAERKPEPRSMKRGNRLVGYGMSSGIWDVIALPARAEAIFTKAGKFIVKSAVNDSGQGSYTVMTQIAAEQFGISTEEMTFKYGDSEHSLSPIQGGSYTTGVVGSAVKAACKELKEELFKKAKRLKNSPFADSKEDTIYFRDGKIYAADDDTVFVNLTDIFQNEKEDKISVTKSNVPNPLKLKQYTRAAHSAAFVEVEVDEQLGTVNVTRAVTAVAAGNIINPKTARSQILGGMVWGISKALREETLTDFKTGRYVNPNLAEYHLPVHADIHDLDVIFVEEKDEIINELGAKGVGEIGLVSMAPAIANAIFHATGRRMTEFPIHFEDLVL